MRNASKVWGWRLRICKVVEITAVHWNNIFKQWRVSTIFETEFFFNLLLEVRFRSNKIIIIQIGKNKLGFRKVRKYYLFFRQMRIITLYRTFCSIKFQSFTFHITLHIPMLPRLHPSLILRNFPTRIFWLSGNQSALWNWIFGTDGFMPIEFIFFWIMIIHYRRWVWEVFLIGLMLNSIWNAYIFLKQNTDYRTKTVLQIESS